MQQSKILIIGGGPAGMEAAAQLKHLGHNPVIIEKNNRLGGHLAKWDRLFPEGTPAKELLDKMLLSVADVECKLNVEVASISKSAKQFQVVLSDASQIQADAILVATGFDLFKAEKKQEYGYGIYNKVITNTELEQYFNTGTDVRIDNPKRIGFVHCVGSRDEKVGNTFCSKVCCATALKQACEMKTQFPDADIYAFYMDLRMFGAGYEDLYLKAQQQYDIKCIRGRVCEVSENIEGNLVVKAEDTLFSKPLKITLDLLVLMCGMENAKSSEKICKMLDLDKNSDGFLNNINRFLDMNSTQVEGVFVAGACTAPQTLPDAIAEARSAAVEINNYLNNN